MGKAENVFDKAAATWEENPVRIKLAQAITEAIKAGSSLKQGDAGNGVWLWNRAADNGPCPGT